MSDRLSPLSAGGESERRLARFSEVKIDRSDFNGQAGNKLSELLTAGGESRAMQHAGEAERRIFEMVAQTNETFGRYDETFKKLPPELSASIRTQACAYLRDVIGAFDRNGIEGLNITEFDRYRQKAKAQIEALASQVRATEKKREDEEKAEKAGAHRKDKDEKKPDEGPAGPTIDEALKAFDEASTDEEKLRAIEKPEEVPQELGKHRKRSEALANAENAVRKRSADTFKWHKEQAESMKKLDRASGPIGFLETWVPGAFVINGPARAVVALWKSGERDEKVRALNQELAQRKAQCKKDLDRVREARGKLLSQGSALSAAPDSVRKKMRVDYDRDKRVKQAEVEALRQKEGKTAEERDRVIDMFRQLQAAKLALRQRGEQAVQARDSAAALKSEADKREERIERRNGDIQNAIVRIDKALPAVPADRQERLRAEREKLVKLRDAGRRGTAAAEIVRNQAGEAVERSDDQWLDTERRQEELEGREASLAAADLALQQTIDSLTDERNKAFADMAAFEADYSDKAARLDEAGLEISEAVLLDGASHGQALIGLGKTVDDADKLPPIEKPGVWNELWSGLEDQLGAYKWLIGEKIGGAFEWLGEKARKHIPIAGHVIGFVPDLAAGILQGSTEMIAGIGTMIAHPIDTAKGIGVLFGTQGGEKAGEAWKEMGKAIIAYDDWKDGKYGQATGKAAVQAILAIVGTPGASAAGSGAKLAYQAARAGGAGLGRSLAKAAASSGYAFTVENGVALGRVPGALARGVIKAPGAIGRGLVGTVKMPGRIRTWATRTPAESATLAAKAAEAVPGLVEKAVKAQEAFLSSTVAGRSIAEWGITAAADDVANAGRIIGSKTTLTSRQVLDLVRARRQGFKSQSLLRDAHRLERRAEIAALPEELRAAMDADAISSANRLKGKLYPQHANTVLKIEDTGSMLVVNDRGAVQWVYSERVVYFYEVLRARGTGAQRLREAERLMGRKLTPEQIAFVSDVDGASVFATPELQKAAAGRAGFSQAEAALIEQRGLWSRTQDSIAKPKRAQPGAKLYAYNDRLLTAEQMLHERGVLNRNGRIRFTENGQRYTGRVVEIDDGVFQVTATDANGAKIVRTRTADQLVEGMSPRRKRIKADADGASPAPIASPDGAVVAPTPRPEPALPRRSANTDRLPNGEYFFNGQAYSTAEAYLQARGVEGQGMVFRYQGRKYNGQVRRTADGYAVEAVDRNGAVVRSQTMTADELAGRLRPTNKPRPAPDLAATVAAPGGPVGLAEGATVVVEEGGKAQPLKIIRIESDVAGVPRYIVQDARGGIGTMSEEGLRAGMDRAASRGLAPKPGPAVADTAPLRAQRAGSGMKARQNRAAADAYLQRQMSREVRVKLKETGAETTGTIVRLDDGTYIIEYAVNGKTMRSKPIQGEALARRLKRGKRGDPAPTVAVEAAETAEGAAVLGEAAPARVADLSDPAVAGRMQAARELSASKPGVAEAYNEVLLAKAEYEAQAVGPVKDANRLLYENAMNRLQDRLVGTSFEYNGERYVVRQAHMRPSDREFMMRCEKVGGGDQHYFGHDTVIDKHVRAPKAPVAAETAPVAPAVAKSKPAPRPRTAANTYRFGDKTNLSAGDYLDAHNVKDGSKVEVITGGKRKRVEVLSVRGNQVLCDSYPLDGTPGVRTTLSLDDLASGMQLASESAPLGGTEAAVDAARKARMGAPAKGPAARPVEKAPAPGEPPPPATRPVREPAPAPKPKPAPASKAQVEALTRAWEAQEEALLQAARRMGKEQEVIDILNNPWGRQSQFEALMKHFSVADKEPYAWNEALRALNETDSVLVPKVRPPAQPLGAPRAPLPAPKLPRGLPKLPRGSEANYVELMQAKAAVEKHKAALLKAGEGLPEADKARLAEFLTDIAKYPDPYDANLSNSLRFMRDKLPGSAADIQAWEIARRAESGRRAALVESLNGTTFSIDGVQYTAQMKAPQGKGYALIASDGKMYCQALDGKTYRLLHAEDVLRHWQNSRPWWRRRLGL